MAERKVLQKYIPPDFDPSKIPRRKIDKDRQQVVRLMAPFSMRCDTCGEYVYKGKKFNARKEIVKGEEYYGVKIFRFYIKCPKCSAEITFKTDPKNTDYAAEHGASRNFEPWKVAEPTDEDADPLAHLIEEEERQGEELDPMKALEQRTLESKREMDIADALQDLRTRNARNERVNVEAVTESLGKTRRYDPEEEERKKAEEEDEDLVKRYFGRLEEASGSGYRSGESSTSALADASILVPVEPDTAAPKSLSIKRAATEVEPDASSLLSSAAQTQLTSIKAGLPTPAAAKKRKGNPFGLVKKK